MISKLYAWLDDRTGIRKFMDMMLLEHIPGGARWRYVWGSTLAFVFSIQLITGVLLMLHYSPSDSSAWGSVFFIQYKMDFGWLIRGLHHFGSQTMVVLCAIHMLQVVVAGAHLAPREINWWLGLLLLGIVFALSLTGYLLPWDQKGFYATTVATGLMGGVPFIGSYLQNIVVGGPEYGNHTLTHFYALHVGVLPPTLILLMILHITVFRRHGVTSPKNAPGMGMFWPDQAFRDLVACLLIFGVMLYLVIFGGHGNSIDTGVDRSQVGFYERWAHAGLDGRGANLDAPADRDTAGYPARPEWYFLFLFQLLKYVDAFTGSMIIPNGILALLFILPLFGHGAMRKPIHYLSILIVLTVFAGALALTVLALADDAPGGVYLVTFQLLKLYVFLAIVLVFSFRRLAPTFAKAVMLLLFLGLAGLYGVEHFDKSQSGFLADLRQIHEGHVVPGQLGDAEHRKLSAKKAAEFEHAVEVAHVEAGRAVQLAYDGIMEEGARYLVRRDPNLKGPELFKANCATCHKYTAPPGQTTHEDLTKGNFRASDLGGYAGHEWIRGLLENPADPKYFGSVIDPETKELGLTGMIKWRKKVNRFIQENPEMVAELKADLDTVSKWLAQQKLEPNKRDAKLEEAGKAAFQKDPFNCVECHTVGSLNDGTSAPDLTDYGSQEWLRSMIMSPGHKTKYGNRNLMPGFRNLDGPGAAVALQDFKASNGESAVINLSDVDREIIIRWMTGDPRAVFGGTVVSGPPKK